MRRLLEESPARARVTWDEITSVRHASATRDNLIGVAEHWQAPRRADGCQGLSFETWIAGYDENEQALGHTYNPS